MKAIMSSIVFCLFTAPLIQAQTLEDYLILAAENNPGLQAAYADFEASMQTVAQVRSLPDPDLSFGYFIQPVQTRTGPQQAKIGLSQMFPWFGSLRSAGRVRELEAEAKYQEFLQAKNELFLHVRTAWYELYETHAMIALQSKDLEVLEQYSRLATSGYENSRNSMVDVLRVDLLIEQSENELQLLQQKMVPLRSRFNQWLNRNADHPVQMPDTLLIGIPEASPRDSLFTSHPILRAYDLQYQAAQEQEELAVKQGRPSIGIGVDYVIVGKRNDLQVTDNGRDAIMPMVSVRIPIQRSRYRAAVKAAQFKQEAIAYRKEDFALRLRSEYDLASYALLHSSANYGFYSGQLDKVQQALNLLTVSYGTSGEAMEEVLRMDRQLLRYRTMMITEVCNYHLANAKLTYLSSQSQ